MSSDSEGPNVDWLNSNAGALTGLAAVATALATATLAFITFRYIHLTRDLVSATKIEAEATREEAQATREEAEASREQAKASRDVIGEMQRDRELSVRPHFTREIPNRVLDSSVQFEHVPVANFGRGPGINCVVVEVSPDGTYLKTDFFDLSGNEQATIELNRQNGAYPTEDIVGDAHTSNRRHALFCQDQFGTCYRFTRRSRPPDTWDERAIELGLQQSAWADWYLREILTD